MLPHSCSYSVVHGALMRICLPLFSSMVLSQMVSAVEWMKVVVFGRSSMLPHSCSYSVTPKGLDEHLSSCSCSSCFCCCYCCCCCCSSSSSSSVFEHGSVSNSQYDGLDEGRGLRKVLHVASQLFLQRCSIGPLQPSCFSGRHPPSKILVDVLPWTCCSDRPSR